MQLVQNQKIRDALKVILLLLWLIIIFYLSSLSYVVVTEYSFVDLIIKKIGHFIGYGFLMFFFFKVVTLNKNIIFKNAIYIALGLTLIYSISDEVHQMFVPFRHPSLFDVCIDMLGATFSWYLIVREKKYQIVNLQKQRLVKI